MQTSGMWTEQSGCIPKFVRIYTLAIKDKETMNLRDARAYMKGVGKKKKKGLQVYLYFNLKIKYILF